MTAEDASGTSSRDITIDRTEPSVSLAESKEYVSSDETLTFEVSDEYTDIVNISAEETGDSDILDDENTDNCDSGDTCDREFTLDTSNLDSGDSVDVQVTSYDVAGNQYQNTFSFTFDNSYDGSSSVSYEFDDEHIFLMDDSDEDQSFNIDLGDSTDENADIELRCHAGSFSEDDRFDTTGYETVDDGGYEYSCEIPGDDYSDESVNVKVEACDEAGNCEEIDDEVTYYMDASPPFVTDVSSSAEISTFNNNFDLTFEASDGATSIEEMEYFFDDATVEEGEGTQVDNFDEGQFTVDLAGLSNGDHTLYIRAKDEAGRWSDPQSFDFEYLPNQNPEVGLSVPESLTVTAGESKSFDITLENTGEFFIEAAEVSVNSDVLSGTKSVSELEPGDSQTVSFTADGSENSIGEYTVDVSTSSPSSSTSFNYRVKANQNQKDSIDSKLSTYSERLQALEANVTELKEKVNDQKAERLESNLTEFRNDVQEAQSAIDNGEYYKAQSALESIESDFQTAQTSYQTVEKEYQNSRGMRFILLGLGVVLVSGVGVTGFLIHENKIDVDIDFEELKETGVESIENLDFSGIEEKISDLFDRSEDAEDFEWDGFRD